MVREKEGTWARTSTLRFPVGAVGRMKKHRGMSLNVDPVEVPWRRLGLWAGAAAWFSALCWWHRLVVVDDPWITFRYARHVWEGAGFVFNPGEPVEGYSNFLWLWTSVLAHAGRIEPFSAARVLGWVFGVATLGLLVCRRWDGEVPPWRDRGVVAAVLLSGAFPFAVWAIGGLETASHAFLVLLAVMLVNESTRRDSMGWTFASGGALALVGMSRPEGAMFLALPLVGALAARRREVTRRQAVALALALGVLFVYTAWRWATFGTVVPNTVSAKIGGDAGTTLGRGLAYFWETFGGALGLLLVAAIPGAIGPLGRLARSRAGDGEGMTVYTVAAALQLVFAVAVGGDWMPAGRFFVPALPLLAVLAAGPLVRLPAWGAGVAVGGFLVAAAAQAKLDPHLNWYRWAGQADGGRLTVAPLMEAGAHLRNTADPDAVLAATEAGVVPYISRLRFIDMLGLVDAHIAGLEGGLHGKVDADYVLGREPDLVLLTLIEDDGGWRAPWPSDAGVYTHPDFADTYREAASWPRLLNGPGYGLIPARLVLYERLESSSSASSSEMDS